MAKLVVSFDGVVQGHYFLDKDRFTIGRKSDNDISLDDPGISKIHATILTVGNDQVLEDAGSTNGLMVNGEKVAKRILHNNDVVKIGCYNLKYINQRASSDMDFDKTLIMTAAPWEKVDHSDAVEPHTRPQLATAVSAARSVKASFPLGGVKYVNGHLAGQEVLVNRPLKTFAHPGGQIVVITRRPHGYYVTHVDGKKHPKVNGKVIGTQPWQLQENDLIEFADQKMIFFMKR